MKQNILGIALAALTVSAIALYPAWQDKALALPAPPVKQSP